MQVFDSQVYDIVEKATEGNGLTCEEACVLHNAAPYSKEAAYIRWVG